MRIAKIVGGLILVLAGIVWMLQGLGASYVPTSFMTRAPEWILFGLLTAIGGTVILVRSLRQR
jgi:hypothetical protein